MNANFAQRDGHGKSTNGHGEVMDKYFAKSVGTLHGYTLQPHSVLISMLQTIDWSAEAICTLCASYYYSNRMFYVLVTYTGSLVFFSLLTIGSNQLSSIGKHPMNLKYYLL